MAFDPLRSSKLNHEVSVFSKERHLALRIATIGAVRIGFYEFANRETIRCLLRGDGGVLTHCWSPFSTRDTAEPFSIRSAARLPILLSAISKSRSSAAFSSENTRLI